MSLLDINVNEHTEKKGGLTYLSWAWAWAEVLKADPKATWEHVMFGTTEQPNPCMWIGDTAMVVTRVTINGLARDCLLPVMDHKNNAVKNPDARKISDAIMRCMTKAIAMHGLGLYIYAGEDLPESEKTVEETDLERDLKASIAANEAKREGELDERALDMIEAFHAKREGDAIKGWFDPSFYKNTDEKAYVWQQLRAESALRALLQANDPNRDHRPAPTVERMSPGPGLKKIGKPITTGATQ